MSLEAQTVPDSPPPESRWRNIEPILKWVSVAYVFGFLIVMFHTWRLGIPTLQLLEPVNIWIGTPLAIVLFFLDKIYAAVHKPIDNVIQSFRDTSGFLDDIDMQGADAETLIVSIYRIYAIALAQFAAVLGMSLYAASAFTWLLAKSFERASSLSGKSISELFGYPDGPLPHDQRAELLNRVAPILRWSRRIGAAAQALAAAEFFFLLVLACALYVAVYSRIPQTLGGGRPLAIKLLVAPDALPRTPEFKDWHPAQPITPSPEAAPHAASKPDDESKQAILVPVTLYFRTEHELFVRKDNGPVVALSDHAIEGILFNPHR